MSKEETNWDLVECAFNTIMDNTDGVLLICVKNLPDGSSDSYPRCEANTEDDIALLVGLAMKSTDEIRKNMGWT